MPDSSRQSSLVLLAGGGSGGHVFPALAVGEELRRRGLRPEFAGSESGMEARLVRERDLPFNALPAKPLVGRGLAGKVEALWTLARSTLAARSLIKKRGVAAVVGTGGYASAPAVLGARLAGVPSVLVEPNAGSGLANRWLSRWASAAAVAYDKTLDEMECPARVTGVPVRPDFSDIPALTREQLDAGPRLLVLGGSQGARRINETMPRALKQLEERHGDAMGRVRVRHQAGRHLEDEARKSYADAGLQHVDAEVTAFIDDMVGAMTDAHLIVSRAGAITMAEMAAAGRGVILVPLSLAGGHQITNARTMADAGAGRVIVNDELIADRLAQVLEALLLDPEALAAAGRASRSLAHPDAVSSIADLVQDLIEKEGRRS
jgi:UDP-N-acetylglucosamine--N-acetylmuramyl-(pentapeptide) pyrophosphoryl-undecaprenol N-acetylglucosamine transferase